MSGFEARLRQAVSQAVSADPVLQAEFGQPVRLYDRQRQDAAFPYLAWSRWQSMARDGDAVRLSEIRARLHVRAGRGDVLALTELVRERLSRLRLNGPPDMPGRLVSMTAPFSDVLQVRGDERRRGVVRLIFLIEHLDMEDGP